MSYAMLVKSKPMISSQKMLDDFLEQQTIGEKGLENEDKYHC